jgi:hypothetical protein
MSDPVNNNARHLASQYGLSIPRVESILKLKGLEENWKEVRQFSSCIPAPVFVMSFQNRLVLKTTSWLKN